MIDETRKRGWPSVRGNGDDLLVRIADGRPAAEAGLGKIQQALDSPLTGRVDT